MRKFLWAVLIASIIAMLPLIYLRVSNENSNRSVITAGNLSDYISEIKKYGTGSQPVLRKHKDGGATAIIVDENEISRNGSYEGTEIKAINELHAIGLDIVVRLQSLNQTDKFYARLSDFVDRYKVKYLLVCPGYEVRGALDSSSSDDIDISELSRMVSDKKLIVFIMENKAQNGYSSVPGLDKLILAAGYRINRAFSISSSSIGSTSAGNAVFVWLRAVVDRNIRMIIVSSSDFSGGDYPEQAISSLQSLHSLLSQRGFYSCSGPKPLNTALPFTAAKIPVFINLFTASALYLLYLCSAFKASVSPTSGKTRLTGKKTYLILLSIMTILTLAGFMLVILYGGVGTAFISALVYPSLSSLLILGFLETNRDSTTKSLFTSLAVALLILLTVNLTGAAVVIASMSDIRYIMHLVNFNLVNPAYILPLLAFAINFASFRKAVPFSLKSMIKDDGISNPTALKHVNRRGTPIIKYSIAFFILIAAMFLYLERNGNYSIIPASAFELEVRKLLETVFYARPRIKEFLVGYPALFLFIYFYKRNASNTALFITGILSSITGISIINSFCHGFTPAAVSLARTLGGLATGIPIGIAALGAASLLRRIKA